MGEVASVEKRTVAVGLELCVGCGGVDFRSVGVPTEHGSRLAIYAAGRRRVGGPGFWDHHFSGARVVD
jgi:hypothetical protein